MSLGKQLEGAPEEFARAAVTLAIRRFGLPGELEASAFVDGFGDLGIDGIAIALDGIPLQTADSIPDNIAPDAALDIMFMQSKRPEIIKKDDIVLFGNAVRTFLTIGEDNLLKLKPSEEILAHWRVIHELRTRFPAAAEAADITMLFAYGGHWKDFNSVNIHRDNVLMDIRNALPSARVEFEIWGLDQLQDADCRFGDGAVRTLENIQLMPLPPGPASGYIGYVNAQSLVDFASSPRTGKAGGKRTADDFMFLDNVRAFIGVDHDKSEKYNPGAFGLKATLERGEHGSIITGHNGIVVVADKARLDANAIELTNAQIVNGCQSTHVMVAYSGRLKDCHLPVKIIVTQDEDTRDLIAIASNTQAEVGNYDILARMPNVKSLELVLGAAAVPLNERVWFQRRRNQTIDFPEVWDRKPWHRVVQPRHLLDAFASTILQMPHTAHDEPRKVVKLAHDGIAFHPDHEPVLYRLLAWMIVTGRRWAYRRDRNWKDQFEHAGGRTYPARHQYIWALWNITVLSSEMAQPLDIDRGRQAHDTFRAALEQLLYQGDAFGDLAGQAVDDAVPKGRRLNADLVRTKMFTDSVAAAAARLRT